MMKIIRKFHLDFSTLFFFLLSFCCGYFKQTVLIFFLVLWHEFGHILAIFCCGYHFSKIDLYPFGGITRIEKPVNSSINKEIFISLAGVFFQLILFPLLFLCQKLHWIYFPDYRFFLQMNKIILLFNLLPIIPLDGSISFHSLLEKIFPYEKAFQWYEMISFISLILFCALNIYFQWDNYFICGVLWTQFFSLKKKKKYWIHRFYLERYLKEYPYKKIEHEKTANIHKLKKETLHFFWKDQKYIHEREMLKNSFERKKNSFFLL